MVEPEAGRDALGLEPRDAKIDQGRVETVEEALRSTDDAQVLAPPDSWELEAGLDHGGAVEQHRHRAGRRVDDVAAPPQLLPRRIVRLVNPDGEALDPRIRVELFHGAHGGDAFQRSKEALEDRVVVDRSRGLVSEDRDSGARETVDRCARRAPREGGPAGCDRRHPACVELRVGDSVGRHAARR